MGLVLVISLFLTYFAHGLTIDSRDAVNNAIYPTNELERKNLELTKQDYKDFKSATISLAFYSAIIAGIIPMIIMIVNIKNFIKKREHYLSFGIEFKRIVSKDKKLSPVCFELGHKASLHLRSVF